MAKVTKARGTKAHIVDEALSLASTVGLSAMTIGSLATVTGMSKSGLFAHFGSKEQLHLQILAVAQERFKELVVKPAFRKAPGEPRIVALFENTINVWEKKFPGGCVFYAISPELDDQPGPSREYLIAILREYDNAIALAVRIAIEEGHFRKDLDVDQFVFDFRAINTAYHYLGRLMENKKADAQARKAFSALLSRSRKTKK